MQKEIQMKIAVMNFSGNVGKSLVSKHLLLPRVPGACLIAIETINADEGSDANMRGNQFGELSESLSVLDNVVVDVGASNVEAFIAKMEKFKHSHEDFDYFVIPTVSVPKQIRDTIATIVALSQIGVPKERIKVVFNRVEDGADIKEAFPSIVEFANEGTFDFCPSAVIHESELFIRLNGRSVDEVMLIDGKELMSKRATAKTEERVEIGRLLSARRLAEDMQEEMNEVFSALFDQ